MAQYKRPFKIIPYTSDWKNKYQLEKEALFNVFGEDLKSIHHIGSTAIVWAMSKPEIDILAVVHQHIKISKFDRKIEQLGYRVRGECLEAGGTKGRFYYSKDIHQIRTHKLHVCHTGHPEILKKLLFVKYLTAFPKIAQQYSELKLELSKQFNYGPKIASYIAGKTSFIEEVLRKARQQYSGLHESDFAD